MRRFFTLEQAKAALPQASRLMRESVHARARYQEAAGAIQALTQRILIMGGLAVDTSVAEAWKTQRDSNEQTLKSTVEKLEEIGCIVKDLEVGLVDFPTLFRGEEVYLCWRVDEQDIEFWHGVHEGFAGRRPIDQNFLDNHRGDA